MDPNTDHLREKIRSATPIYRGKLIDLDDVTVELPDGRPGKREIVRHPGAVAVVPLLDNGDVILVRQFRVAAEAILLEIPAGTLNPGEDPAPAAVRELQEEIGYRPGQMVPLAGEYTAPGYTTEFIQIYLATDLKPSQRDADDDEFLEVVRMPLHDAIRLIDAGEIKDGKTIIGLLQVARWQDGQTRD